MSINVDVQTHWSWFEDQDLWLTTVEKGVTLGSII